jgi:hypothetical protein
LDVSEHPVPEISPITKTLTSVAEQPLFFRPPIAAKDAIPLSKQKNYFEIQT